MHRHCVVGLRQRGTRVKICIVCVHKVVRHSNLHNRFVGTNATHTLAPEACWRRVKAEKKMRISFDTFMHIMCLYYQVLAEVAESVSEVIKSAQRL